MSPAQPKASNLMTRPRKWTATLCVAGQEFPAPISAHDTLADQTRVVVAEAASLIRDYEIGSDASVTLYKQLRDDDAPVRDRSVYVYRDDNGQIKTQR
jgi:hypothetical protein